MERAMSEVDFEQMIDAVRNAVMPVPVKDSPMAGSMAGLPVCAGQPKAANDNFDRVWPIVPFPEGWHFA
jgi:hypothetical protein